MNLRALTFASGVLVALTGTVHGQSTPVPMEDMHQLHQNPAAYVALLDDPARDAYQKPHDVVMALDLKDGEHIADIGSGSGYFALRFARHVGAQGRVLAVDVSPDMVILLNRRIRDAGLDNVRTVLAVPDDPLLADASVDRVFICDTWHHIEGHPAYLQKLRKLLKPGGQVIVIDFKAAETPVGPPVSMRVSREDVVKEFEGQGFRLTKEHSMLPYQYFLVFGAGTR
jgi:arsenite methyltransferase